MGVIGKLIGIDANTRQLRLPRGAPYHLKLRVVSTAGEAQTMAGRDLAFTIYRGADVSVTVAGTIGANDDGPFAAFALTGEQTATIPLSSSWEIAELYSDGKAPLLVGPVLPTSTASSAAGDGSYLLSSAADELTWSPATDVVLVVERGPRGPPADGVSDPGDLTLIFENHLI